MKVSASTRIFALLGDPVAHSLSPRFQNAGFQAAGLDAVYLALRTPADQVPQLMATLAANGGGGNITVPHKQVAAAVHAQKEARVEQLGAANTFAGRNGTVVLDNTDVDGILAAAEHVGASGTVWCVIGTGGSARAVAAAAHASGAALTVSSRRPDRAATFTAWASSIGVNVADPSDAEFAINATPLGLHADDALPLDPERYPKLSAVLDLTYHADGPTRWVQSCRQRGLRGSDGREVLLAQGAASWRLWFPGISPPVEVMRAALDGRLG